MGGYSGLRFRMRDGLQGVLFLEGGGVGGRGRAGGEAGGEAGFFGLYRKVERQKNPASQPHRSTSLQVLRPNFRNPFGL